MAGFAGHNWAFAFGLLGNVVSFMVYLSPIPTFYQIYKKKTSEGYQSIPYVIGLFSSMLWIYYAFLKTNVTLLITINSVGIFTQTVYICFYLFYAPKKLRVETFKLFVLLIFCGFGFIVISTRYFVTKDSQRAYIVGWICLVFSLCVFVAPLGIVRQVIRTKSVEYMPFLLSFFLTLSAVMWFFYGLLIKDFNVAIPNVLGFSFGVLQMALYVKYRSPEKINEHKPSEIQTPQVIVLDHEQKLPEQVIDIVKISELLHPNQKIPVASQLNDNSAMEAAQQYQNMPKEIEVKA